MPLVSVIIPSYQGADVLHKAFDSVQQQTFSDLEVLIVDDGSTDNTREVVQAASAADPRIRYLYQENQGPAAARNTPRWRAISTRPSRCSTNGWIAGSARSTTTRTPDDSLDVSFTTIGR